MFVVLNQKETIFTINLDKIQVFYPMKDGTRIELEDGTIIDVKESFEQINDHLRYISLLTNKQ